MSAVALWVHSDCTETALTHERSALRPSECSSATPYRGALHSALHSEGMRREATETRCSEARTKPLAQVPARDSHDPSPERADIAGPADYPSQVSDGQ